MKRIFDITPAGPVIGMNLPSIQYEDLGYAIRAWRDFLNGRWTEEPPERTGWYPLLARDGGLPSLRLLEVREGVVRDPARPGPFRWAGKVWSLPVPVEWLFYPERYDDESA